MAHEPTRQELLQDIEDAVYNTTREPDTLLEALYPTLLLVLEHMVQIEAELVAKINRQAELREVAELADHDTVELCWSILECDDLYAQRNLYKQHIALICKSISRGFWHLDAETLRLTENAA